MDHPTISIPAALSSTSSSTSNPSFRCISEDVLEDGVDRRLLHFLSQISLTTTPAPPTSSSDRISSHPHSRMLLCRFSHPSYQALKDLVGEVLLPQQRSSSSQANVKSKIAELVWQAPGIFTSLFLHVCTAYPQHQPFSTTNSSYSLPDCHHVMRFAFLLDILLRDAVHGRDVLESRLITYVTSLLSVDRHHAGVEQMKLSILVCLVSATQLILQQDSECKEDNQGSLSLWEESPFETYLCLTSGDLLINVIRCLTRTTSEISLGFLIRLLKIWLLSNKDHLLLLVYQKPVLLQGLTEGLDNAERIFGSTAAAGCSKVPVMVALKKIHNAVTRWSPYFTPSST